MSEAVSGVQFYPMSDDPTHPLKVRSDTLELDVSDLPTHMSTRHIMESHIPLLEDRYKVGDWMLDEEERPETDEEVWARKLQEGRSRGLEENIREHGVEEPVFLGTTLVEHPVHGESYQPEVLGGHNRIAVQNSIDPEKPIPVRFFTGTQGRTDFQEASRASNPIQDRHGWRKRQEARQREQQGPRP